MALHQKVGLVKELVNEIPASGGLQVEGHAVLVGIEVQKEGACLRMGCVGEEGALEPAGVPARQRFHFDDLSA
jgi:hypothetical protein